MPVLQNQRHELFCQNRVKGLTIDASYVEAGFKANRSNASQLNSKKHIQDRISEIQGRIVKRLEISIDRTAQEMAKLAYSDISHAVEFDGSNFKLKAFDKIDPNILAAISEIWQDKDGNIRFKMYDKQAALVSLARYQQMFTERVEVTTKTELATRMMDALARVRLLPQPPLQIEHDPAEFGTKADE